MRILLYYWANKMMMMMMMVMMNSVKHDGVICRWSELVSRDWLSLSRDEVTWTDVNSSSWRLFASAGHQLNHMVLGSVDYVFFSFSVHTHTHTHTFNGPFFQDYPGEPVPER